MERVQRYPESLPDEREREAKAAAALKLLDTETGQPTLPDSVVNQVASRYGPAGAAPRGGGAVGPGTVTGNNAVQDLMPSDASGGLSWEDRLR